MRKHRFSQSVLALVALFALMLGQVTTVLAGTTGNLSGTVVDSKTHQPIAGATVTASSPSQNATAHTDASGNFTILGLNPDTYTVSAQKEGYNPVSTPGVTVSADQTQRITLNTENLRTIARVTTRARTALVQPGVTANTYSISSAGAAAAAALGSGGQLDSNYSAMASVPGVNSPIGGAGWDSSAAYIHGNQYFFTSYEYDGIPINRAFDNYNSSTESSLGLQELQVYTGGGPASNSSAGTSGFINQVIKSGTYPASGSLEGGLGAVGFYHNVKFEYGGSTANRNFSYYVGVSGYNQDFRYPDNDQGASLFAPGAEFDYSPQFSPSLYNNGPGGSNERGVWPVCQHGTATSPIASTNPVYGFGYNAAQCFIYNSAANAAVFGNQSGISDREDVANFHFGIPHKDGTKDDIQLLGSASSMQTTFYSSPNDAGGYGPYTLSVTGLPYCPPSGTGAPGCAVTGGPNYPFYLDVPAVYNLPFGTPIQNAVGVDRPTQPYFQPSSPGGPGRTVDQQIGANTRDTLWNDNGIFKLQYTKTLGTSAYARIFGYTFFSDWTQAGADAAYNYYLNGIGGPFDGAPPPNYDLITHTAGGEVQLADQVGQHLLSLTSNYVTAKVSRFNNDFWLNAAYGGSLVGYVSQSNGNYTCYTPLADPTTGLAAGAAVPCLPSEHATAKAGNFTALAGNGPFPTAPAGSPAQVAGAQWVTLQNGSTYGTYNTVKPIFTYTALQDNWSPTSRLTFNYGLRLEDFRYDLPSATPGTSLYAAVIPAYVCQNASGTLYTKTLAPGQAPPAPVIYAATCPSGFFHPAFSASSPPSYTLAHLSPKGSFTYKLDPLTVVRGSIGEYTQPPISASVQYLSSSGNELSIWNATLPLGFHSPFHPIPLQVATQADLSLEHQIRGTDVSLKLSPFYNYSNAYQQQATIGPNFATQVPVGAFRSQGVEFALTKGDFGRDGLSGSLAFTYTDAKLQYQSKYFGSNQISQADGAISQFNTLTKAGGGAPCYTEAVAGTKTTPAVFGAPASCAAAHTVTNPYYNMPLQALLDPGGWYTPGVTGLSATSDTNPGYYDAPILTSLIVSYKHGPFSITPGLQLQAGTSYGQPFDVAGLDPRTCVQNAGDAGITTVSPSTNPQACNYLSTISGNASPGAVAGQLFIPNPQTGFFAKPGQFQNPTLLTANVQLHYDLSNKVALVATFANIFHTCFGGSSEPWTSGQYAPNANTCFYTPNSFYTSNFYNGTSSKDAAANGLPAQYFQTKSYVPGLFGSEIGSSTGVPFNAYLQLQVKL